MNGFSNLGGGELSWAETLKPSWQLEAEATTRIFVVVYPSERGRIFGPGGSGTDTKFPRNLTKDEFSTLGYGIYVDPANGATKGLFGNTSKKNDQTLFTFEEDNSGNLAVHKRSGVGVGTHGMLVRFLVAQHGKAASVPRFCNLIQSIMADVLPNHKSANERALYDVLEQMQGTQCMGKWSLDQFLETVDMVVENQREEGVKRIQTTTVNYIASLGR